MENKYSFLKGLKKSALALAIFALPFLLNQFPDIANLTIGSILALGINYLKVKYDLSV